MLLWFVAALLIFSAVPATASLDYNDYSLQRIARAPHPSSALLVPYPRVGKRSNVMKNSHHGPSNSVQKGIYMARVGKRALFYTPRIGK